MIRVSRKHLWLGLTFIVFIGVIFLVHSDAKRNVAVNWPPPRLDMNDCIKWISEIIPSKNGALTITEISVQVQTCEFYLRSQGKLDDFQIIRAKFYQQNYADTIILWMVVFITVSGIALAAVQLLISYRLANTTGTTLAEMGGELTVEQGKVSLKSSLAGIFILTISFGFFWLFTIYIHPLKVVDLDGNQSQAASQQTGQMHGADTAKTSSLGSGGFGSDPSQEASIPIPEAVVKHK